MRTTGVRRLQKWTVQPMQTVTEIRRPDVVEYMNVLFFEQLNDSIYRVKVHQNNWAKILGFFVDA